MCLYVECVCLCISLSMCLFCVLNLVLRVASSQNSCARACSPSPSLPRSLSLPFPLSPLSSPSTPPSSYLSLALSSLVLDHSGSLLSVIAQLHARVSTRQQVGYFPVPALAQGNRLRAGAPEFSGPAEEKRRDIRLNTSTVEKHAGFLKKPAYS